MPTYDPRKLIGPLAIVSVLETVTFLLVLAAMALLDKGELRSAAGAVHGLLFALYAALLFLARRVLDWSLGFVALGILTGPIGAIIVLERMRRRSVATAPAE
jgi:integral membrane protein